MSDLEVDLEVVPGVGIGPLVLGMTQDEVRNVLGAPDEADREQWEGGTTLHWLYDEFEIRLSFSSEDDKRLGSINAGAEFTTLDGERVIGRSEAALLQHMESRDRGPLEVEEECDAMKLRGYSWDEMSVVFWISAGKLESITVMPVFDEAGENPLWPERKTD